MTGAEEKYSDIIDMPHHRSAKHPHMSMTERAAQFSPFAALTGFEARIVEEARLTDSKAELDEEQMLAISSRLGMIEEKLSELRGVSPTERTYPLVSVVYFVKDKRKDGGEYVTVQGRVKKIDQFQKKIFFEDGTKVPVEDIYEVTF